MNTGWPHSIGLRSAALLVAPLTACAPAPPPPPAPPDTPWFEEIASEAGVEFTWSSGHVPGRLLMPEIMGGGAASLDMDDDGDLDLYLVQGGSLDPAHPTAEANRLFENDGTGHFRDVTASAGDAADIGYGMGVAAGDYDDDGDIDLYVTNVGPNALLRNDGSGSFRNVAAAAGVDHGDWGTSAAFLDYDQDGDLDLFFTNYVFWSLADEIACFTDAGVPDYCSPRSYGAPAPDVLYRNDGAGGGFTEVSAEAGLRSAFGNGLGVVVADFDADGRPDIFVANDQTQNQLWANRGGGRFEDVAPAMGCALDSDGKAKAGMGTHAADFDGDGDEDLLVVNLRGQSDSLYRNAGTYFTDDTAVAGLGVPSRPFTRFGLAFADFDNDGALDLYMANGAVTLPTDPPASRDPYAEANLLLAGQTNGTWSKRSYGGVPAPMVHTSRAAAFGDLDNDGRPDVVVVNRDGPVYVLRNTVETARRAVTLRVVTAAGRDDLGAIVRGRVDQRTIVRRVRSAYSYLAANDPRVHVGLGAANAITDVEVQWSDGTRRAFGTLNAGFHTLRRGE